MVIWVYISKPKCTEVYMSKQIKVSDAVYNRLKKEADMQFRPLGSHIEYLLDLDVEREVSDYEKKAKQWESQENTPSPKNIEPETLGIDNLLTNQSATELEQSCCVDDFHPCKHWIWDTQTGEGYKNILSGRYKEAE